MRQLQRLLRPGWVLGLLGVVLFTYACLTVLAPWQLGKSEQLDERNSRLVESMEADPIPFADAAGNPHSFTDLEWHLVTMSGEYLPDSEVLLRLRQVDGNNVYQVLTAFRTDEAGTVLVNRGYVPVGEDNTVVDYSRAPSGEVTLTGRLRAAETGPTEPIELHGYTMVRIVDPGALVSVVDQPLVSAGFVQLAADQPGSLAPVPIPSIESGPYLSYGLQWIAFGILAPIALGYFVWTEIRTRSRQPAPLTGPADSDSASQSPTSNSTGDLGDDLSPQERALQQRYGDRFDAERRYARRRANRLDRR